MRDAPRPVEVFINHFRRPDVPAGDVLAAARLARRFHVTLPAYAPTPLRMLPELARRLGVGSVLVKDESPRFGLGAFKGLGSVWAVARVLARRLGIPLRELSLENLLTAAARNLPGKLTFVTATDGNHGRGLAWAARLLGHTAQIFMPEGAAGSRVESIRAQGAQCVVTDLPYDDAVRHAAAHARGSGAILVQDTAWEGYEEIPAWIMEGYGTLALEVLEQMEAPENGGAPLWPTHVFLQAGVGSFAAAMIGCFRQALRERGVPIPRFVSMEPRAADCVCRSLAAGAPRRVPGRLATLMAGLSCGEVSSLAWPVLRDGLAAACVCPDDTARRGMRLLALPAGSDPAVISGESGAVGAGLLEWLRENDGSAGGAALGLGPEARILLISPEGATDPVVWRQSVGKKPPEC